MSTPSEVDARAATAGPSRGELRARVLSSLVLAPAALVMTWTEEPVFAAGVAAGGVVLAREWTRMTDPEGS
ncbi:MAG: hypothetical protein MI723_05855, partial [Caulobacterales bacterium]|nr:hypothetical protein [Caulobacterales bacterium]